MPPAPDDTQLGSGPNPSATGAASPRGASRPAPGGVSAPRWAVARSIVLIAAGGFAVDLYGWLGGWGALLGIGLAVLAGAFSGWVDALLEREAVRRHQREAQSVVRRY